MNLFGLDTINEMDRSEVARRTLNNLLTSYADEADVFNEIIQNSFDSVIKAIGDGLYADNENPKITIVIGRRNEGHHYLYVKDNGTGMPPDVAYNLTVPGFSFGKKKGKTIGYKGVGASYFFAASQKISLRTIDQSGSLTEYTVRGSYEWIKNEEEPAPVTEFVSDVPELIKPLLPTSRGTSIFLQFHDGIKPKNLNGLVIIGQGPEVELKNWVSFLASKTALGTVEGKSAKKVEIHMILDRGSDVTEQVWTLGEFSRENHVVGYPFPQHVFRVGKSIDDIDSTPESQRVAIHTRKHPAVFKRWSSEEIIEVTALDAEEKDKLIQHLKWVEGYLCYSTDVLKTVNDRMGGRSALVRHGMRIAVDGIPQGRNVDLSLTSSQGLDRQSHIVLSFTGLELDTGRKISADEVIASAIVKVGQRIVNILKDYRWAMKKKDRPDITSDLVTWRSSVDARAQTSMVRELFKSLNVAPIFKVDPDNESEVIALFASLLSHNCVRGYAIQALSGYARYDSLCDVDCTSAGVTDLNDPLSVRTIDESLNGAAKVLEFKYSFDDLIVDFQEKLKNPAEIDFVVCWVLPDLNVSRGRVEPSYGKWRDHRSIYAASYTWFDENETSTIPVLVLKNIVAELLAKYESSNGVTGIGKITLAQLEQVDEEAGI